MVRQDQGYYCTACRTTIEHTGVAHNIHYANHQHWSNVNLAFTFLSKEKTTTIRVNEYINT
jgi:hypothetical protein